MELNFFFVTYIHNIPVSLTFCIQCVVFLLLLHSVHRSHVVFRCCSGVASWDYTFGVGATYQESDDSITHHIIDRPTVANQRLDR